MAIGLSLILAAGCALPGDADPRASSTPTHSGAGDPAVDPASSPTIPAPTGAPESLPTVTPTETLPPIEPFSVSAPDCEYGGVFKSIAAVDRYNVRIELCAPEVAFLSKIAFPAFGIQPAEWFGKQIDDSGELFREGVIGSGPYRVVDWVQGEELVFQAHDEYWNGPGPGAQELILRWNIDEVQRLLDLQAGLVDGVDNINSYDYTTVEADPNLMLVPRSPLSTFYLGMNNTAAPFDDERVRRAIAMGIDRAEIVGSHFPEGYEVADFFTPCVIPNGCVGESWYPFDPLGAHNLLDEAGYAGGLQTVLTYRDVARGYLPRPGDVAEAIQEQLDDNLGIQVKLEIMEDELFLQAVDSGALSGMYLLGWGADYPDVANFLDNHFGEPASEQFGDKDPELVQLLDQGTAVFGDEARKPYYQAANNLIRAQVPAIPIAYGSWYAPESLATAYRNSVGGAHASPFGFEDFSALDDPGGEAFTWVGSAEPLSLYCAQESDSDSLRACSQVLEPLYRYAVGDVTPAPWLAEICTPNDDMKVWECKLREGVRFHDGSTLDANDVVMSLWVQWDASLTFHQQSARPFDYFRSYWGEFLNAAAP